MQEQVQEYFRNYFGETLNESISDDQIMDAVHDLVYLTEAVLEAFGDVFAPSGNEPAGTEWKITDHHKSRNIMKKKLMKTKRGKALWKKYANLPQKGDPSNKGDTKSTVMSGNLRGESVLNPKKTKVQTTDINWAREHRKNKGKVPYGQLPKQKRPFGPKQSGKDNAQPM